MRWVWTKHRKQLRQMLQGGMTVAELKAQLRRQRQEAAVEHGWTREQLIAMVLGDAEEVEQVAERSSL